MTLDYQYLKDLAKDLGQKVGDLLALAPNNDPFYMGKPADLTQAKWFKAIWDRFGFSEGVHLRRVHYQVQALGDWRLPTTITWTVKDKDSPRYGELQETDVYLNNKACWQYLCKAAKAARYLGFVNAELFVDRRNPEAIINAPLPNPDDFGYRDPRPRFQLDGGWRPRVDEWDEGDEGRYALPDLPSLPDLPDRLPDHPRVWGLGYDGQPQPYLVEIWSEKSTMNDVINPLAERYGVNHIVGLGEMSITSVLDCLARAAQSGRALRILYVSDFDPAGVGMPISVARKVEYYNDQGLDIALMPIILNPEQISRYELPSAPVKDSDKRKANFEADHGEAVELDALEALHPGALAGIVEAEIRKYFDTDWGGKLYRTRNDWQRILSRAAAPTIDDWRYDLNGLDDRYQDLREEWAETQAEFDNLVAAFAERIEAYRDRLETITYDAASVHDQIREELGTIDVEAPDFPEADVPEEDDDSLLYKAGRDYFDQLEYYNRQRHG